MKWVFVGILFFAIGLTIAVQLLRPKDNTHGVVTLIWATDPNPARDEQIALFCAWHQRKYGEPIAVKVDPANGGYSKVVIQSIAGAGPDLFDLYNGAADLERYVSSGIILDVTEAAKAHNFSADLIWPGIRSDCVYKGRQYTFLDNAAANVMLYNKDMFDQAHLPYPHGPWTWAQFLVVGRKLSYQHPNGLRQFALLDVDPLELTYQNGSVMFSPQGTHCVIANPQASEALRFYVAMRQTEHINPTATEMASQAAAGGWGSGGTTLFTNGYFAASEAGRYWLVLYRKDILAALAKGQPSPYHIGVAPLPYFTKPYVFGYGRSTGVNRASPHAKYAVRFLEFLASEEFNKQINRSFDSVAPVMKYCTGPNGIADGPAPPSGLEAANDRVFLDALQTGHEVEASPFIAPYRVTDLWNEVRGHLDVGEYTPEQTLQAFQQLVNDDIRRNIAADASLRRSYQQALRKEGGR